MLELHSVLFPPTNGTDYERMANALQQSVEVNSPATPLVIHRITDADDDIKAIGKHRKKQFVENVRKTRHHAGIVERATDGQLLCLMDCDTMVLGDLSEAEAALADYDLGITVRPQTSQFIFNSGVVFVRASEATRRFYRKWYDVAEQMLRDESFHLQWKPHWGGIMQSAFGYLTREETWSCRIGSLLCEYWNCEADTWSQFSRHTKVVHIVGALRHACLRNKDGYGAAVDRLAKIWRQYDRNKYEYLPVHA